MVRLPTIATWASAMLAGIATGTNLASHPPHEDLITERSPAFYNKQVSDAINDALARAGFNAGEAAKIRDSYHVDVDQIEDNSDKSRQLLDEALSNMLDKPDVKRIDAALDFLVGKLDGLVERTLRLPLTPRTPSGNMQMCPRVYSGTLYLCPLGMDLLRRVIRASLSILRSLCTIL
jgi:hypothetical protein